MNMGIPQFNVITHCKFYPKQTFSSYISPLVNVLRRPEWHTEEQEDNKVYNNKKINIKSIFITLPQNRNVNNEKC